MKNQYDVIIIGGGISGLTNAALMSRLGFSCCIIEKEPNIGGYLQGFKRGDFIFDTSIHWLNQCGEQGMVTKIFKIIGSDFPKAHPMPNIHRFKSADTNYLLTNTPDELKLQLINDFPHEKKGIEKFFKVAVDIAKASKRFANLMRTSETMNFFEKSIHNLKIFRAIIPMIPYALYSGNKGLEKGLNKFFTDKKLHRLFNSESDLLSCLFPVAWAYNNDYQLPILGGGQIYTRWLKYVIEYFENVIFLKSSAHKIIYENNHVTGVEFIKAGEKQRIFSKYVISAIDIETLYKNLIDNKLLSSKFLNKFEMAELYSSGATVSIALDCPACEIGIYDELISITRHDIDRKEHNSGSPHTSALSIISPSERDKSLAPANKGTLNIYIPADIAFNNYWQTERDENNNFIRGENYKKYKKEFAEILIKRVENELNIDIKSHILFFDVSTPITYFRYTGNKNGSIMGTRPGKINMQLVVAHYKTPIKNLFVSGHWAELGGGVPIAVQSAMNASLLVLKNENRALFNLVKNYIDGKTSLDSITNSGFQKPYDNSWSPTVNTDNFKEKSKVTHKI